MTFGNDFDSFDYDENETAGMYSQQPIDLLGGSDTYGKHSAAYVPEDDYAAYDTKYSSGAKNLKKPIIAGVLTLALLGGVTALALANRPSSAKETATEKVETFVPQTATVTRTEIQSGIKAEGVLGAQDVVVVAPEVEGTVVSILVKEGQKVNEGDVILKLDNPQLDRDIETAERNVQTAELGVASAENTASEARATRDAAWARYNREYSAYDESLRKYTETVQAADGLVMPVAPAAIDMATASDEEKESYALAYEQYERDLETYQRTVEAAGSASMPLPPTIDDNTYIAVIESAEGAVERAQVVLEQANKALETAKQAVEKRIVKAPVTGTVITVGTKLGETYGKPANDGNEKTSGTIKIANLSAMSIDALVSEADLVRIETGMWARAIFPALDNYETNAEVVEIAPTSDSADGNFHVKLAVPNPDPQLKPGMTTSLTIDAGDITTGLVVPDAAVADNGDGTGTVRVVVDMESYRTESRTVRISGHTNGNTIIEEGLAEGEVVLV